MEHVFARLNELGMDEVKRMRDAHEFPTNWTPHIRDWLASKEKAQSSGSFPGSGTK